MAETLTYDAGTDTVTTGDSLTPDEQSSLEVGEALVEQQELVKQAGQFASTPMMDSSKDPDAKERIDNLTQAIQPPQE